MAESGFTLFLQQLQAFKDPPKPKIKTRRTEAAFRTLEKSAHVETESVTLQPRREGKRNVPRRLRCPRPIDDVAASTPPDEDFTSSVCLLHVLTGLYPVYEEVLVDAEDYPFLTQFEWCLVRVGKKRQKRVVRRGDSAYIHRVVMDAPKGCPVDHQFHNPMDNRKHRLRVCTTSQNNLNSRPAKNRTSRFRGVCWNTKRGMWRVQPGLRGERVFLGYFHDEVEAAIAYNEYAKKHFGPFAYLNPV